MIVVWFWKVLQRFGTFRNVVFVFYSVNNIFILWSGTFQVDDVYRYVDRLIYRTMFTYLCTNLYKHVSLLAFSH